MLPFRLSIIVLFLLVSLLLLPFCLCIRLFLTRPNNGRDGLGLGLDGLLLFAEALDYCNGKECPPMKNKESYVSSCDASFIHIVMTLDSEYLRGSMAAVHSVLRHKSCPEHVFFHFVSAEFDSASPQVLTQLVRSTFPSLNFKVYIFREDTVINLISRQALKNPLNYARNYLRYILNSCIDYVIYLDSNVVVVDNIVKLWETNLTSTCVIGAPEYCHANFTKYRKRIENWMEVQKEKRTYKLGSLPPKKFLSN